MGINLCQFCMVILPIANLLLAHESHDKTHNCIHDDIDHKITQQFIQYTNHPLESNNINTQRKLLSQQYAPIRIRPYYDPLLINTHMLSIDKITYIKSLISTSIHYLQQFVKVIPVAEPLLINRCQRVWHYNSFTYNVCPLTDYTEPLKCQYATIPDTHIAESWYYDPLTFQSYRYKGAGTGVSDADLIIYVTYGADQCSQDGKTLAWASICNLDQYGRPIAGTINFCPRASDNNYWKFDVGVTLHEIMHILVMSNSLFPYFYNTNTLSFYGEHNVIFSTTELQNQYIITDKVKQISRMHFGCNTLIGLPLENTGDIGTIGSHWESKYLQSELMCGTMYSAVLYLSYFTFALMEDTGWYGIDYEFAEEFTWGKYEGCNFFQTDCINKYNGNSNFEQYWCTSSNDNGCSYDYTTVGSCMNQLTGIVPSQFRYYTDNQFGGPQSHDYCAFRVPKIPTNNIYKDYEQICWDDRGNWMNTAHKYPSVKFGIDSRCVEINDAGNNVGYCFKHECIGWDYYNKRYNGIKLLISDGLIDNYEVAQCARSQSMQYIKSTVYSFTIKCPNIDSVCGHSTKPFNCYWGKYSDVLNKCICSVGYIGSDCSIMDTNRFALEALTATKLYISQPQFGTGICISNSIKEFINGYYKIDYLYEGLPSYKYNGSINSNTIRYLYYFRYLSQWSIGNKKGDTSIFAYCTDSLNIHQIIDITMCKLWAIWDDINGWIWDVNINIKHCTPTPSPTLQPSIYPTYIPTYNPTINTNVPTNNPTIAPTKYPTYNPTLKPTINPTKTPIFTISPTEIPTYNPSITPTKIPTNIPTKIPTNIPTNIPSNNPTISPTNNPSVFPTISPTNNPSYNPTNMPTDLPTMAPNNRPTRGPTLRPTSIPTYSPTISPTFAPNNRPTRSPTSQPTISPSDNPTNIPTLAPTISPTNTPTNAPINTPTNHPTLKPTKNPLTPTYLDRVTSNLHGEKTKLPSVSPISTVNVKKNDNILLSNNKNSSHKNGSVAIIGIGFIAVFFVVIGFSVIIYALMKYYRASKHKKHIKKAQSNSIRRKTFSSLNADNVSEYNADSELQSMIMID